MSGGTTPEGNDRDAGVIEEICSYLTEHPPRSFFLFAGAGSGKTRTLVEVLRRLTGVVSHESGGKLAHRLRLYGRSIRVVTYTKNAVAVISGRLGINDLSVESRSLRALATGQVYLLDAQGQPLNGALTGRNPTAFVGQLALRDVRIDPEGLFETPVQFEQGALDLRLTPEPFAVEIGQFSLVDGDQRLSLTGNAAVAEGGWQAALDLSMNAVI